MNALRRFEPYAYAFLRIVAGLLFMFHGLQKFGLLARTGAAIFKNAAQTAQTARR